MPDFISTMTLGASHSVIISHAPEISPDIANNLFKVSKIDKKSISKFGLFGGGINYHTYYPEAKDKDFNPSESEFIQPVFRLLSACIVSKNWCPTEFSEDVLKASIPLIIGQTVNCDHSTDIGNAIGSVVDAFWQDAYKTPDGQDIPGGINGKLKIDAKANPRIARGINMDPPSIHSNSVTVQFEWKPSHEFEHPYDFWDKIGTYDEKGNLIRRIATRIISYKETSLVSHGADPFAQKVNEDGIIINPGYAASVYNSFSEVIKEKISQGCKASTTIDYKVLGDIDIIHNTSKIINRGNKPSPVKTTNKISEKMNQELQEFLEKLFGEGMLTLADGTSASAELVLTEIRKLVQDQSDLGAKLNKATEEVTSLNEQINALKKEAKDNESFVEMGKNHFKEVKEATLASYKKLMGEEKADANIISLIEKVDSLSTLVSLKSTYDAQLEDKFPLHCADCGSHNINRGSSISQEENQDDKPKQKSDIDIMKELADRMS